MPRSRYLPRPLMSLAFTMLTVLAGSAGADTSVYTNFGDYRVQHTVFNSSFIKPEIARIYNLTRGGDRALINIAVLRKHGGSQSKGVEARVSGTVANLMQQQRSLEFQEIREQDAIYYLADLRFQNEEVLHFNISVNVDGRDLDVKFSKTLYAD